MSKPRKQPTMVHYICVALCQSAAVLLSAALLATTGFAQTTQTGDEIHQKLNSLQLPELGQGPAERYSASNLELARQHAELGQQIWNNAPDHPAAAAAVRSRWDIMLSVPLAFGDWQGPLGEDLFHALHDDPTSETSRLMLEAIDKCASQVDATVVSECKRALSAGADHPIAKQAYYPIARYHVGRLLDGDRKALNEALSAIDELLELGAETDRTGYLAPRLLSWTADYGFESYDNARRITLLERLQREFPDSNESKSAQGKLRLANAIGKPFALEFEDAIDGEQVSLRDLRGRTVVLDVWATWCAPCLAAMPHLREMQLDVGKERLAVIGISIDEPGRRDQMIEMVKEQAYGWPQLHDPESKTPFADEYGVTRIPFYFLIDKEGILRSAGNDIQQELLEALKTNN